MAALRFEGVTRRFGEATAVDAVSFDIPDGAFWALLGPSGCGKTTILRMAAGFETVSAGTIRIGGRAVSTPQAHLPPEHRRVGIVFQSYALWPHMTVADNVGYALDVKGQRGAARDRLVAQALASVGLSGFERRRPAQLSGGQQQRVALARCLVMRPGLMLFDEPLASLDVHLRAAMEEEFLRLHGELGATMLYITHDQAEAMAMADRIVVMDKGRIQQIAPPRTLYREPANDMVAGFIGQGGLVAATVLAPTDPATGRARARIGSLEVSLRARPDQTPGPALACLRPEDLAPVDGGAAGLPARVVRATYKGRFDAVDLETETGDRLLLHASRPARAGEHMKLGITDGWVVPA